MKVGKSRAAKELGAYLKGNGIKQTWFSEALGFHSQTLGFWVRGTRIPGRGAQVHLADRTGLPVLADASAWVSRGVPRTPTLTVAQVREMTHSAPAVQVVAEILPGVDTTAYTPSEMAELGVDHEAIVWAFLRPDILGDAFGDVVCRLADEVLPVFELAYPVDTRPSAAIAAARKCFASPTPANGGLAGQAAAEARAAAVADVSADCAARAAASASLAADCAAADAPDAPYAARAAADAAEWAVAAGCPPATVLRLIEGASQTAD